MASLNGLQVVTSVWLTEPGEPCQVRRSWRERLFSRHPFQATRTVIPQVPYKGGYLLNDTTIVMHPETLRKVMTKLYGDDRPWFK